MNRHGGSALIREVVAKLRREIPDLVIRTTFIVGFPGETDEDFTELCEFVNEQRFEHVGVFTYSREEGTAADRLHNHLDDAVKVARTNRLKDLQTAVILNRNKNLLGKTVSVLFDEIDYDKQMFLGRAEFQAPDIDNVVYFTADNEVHVGEFYDVEITGADGIDLMGKAL